MSYDRYNDNERYQSGSGNKKLYAIIGLIVAIVIIAFVGLSTVVVVNQGNVGIVKTWGQVTSVQPAGMFFKSPFSDSVEMYNIQVQSAVMSESTATKDQQEVTTEITVNYHVDKNDVNYVYTQFGTNVENTIIIPVIQEALKASTAQYNAEQLTTTRESVKNTIDEKVTIALKPYGITVDEVSITNFAFSPEYQAAIDAKAQAVQEALKAENDLKTKQFESQQAVISAEAQAQAAIIAAQGSANATMISANATASAMQTINEQLTPEYVAYLYALGWDGKLPVYYSGDSLPIIMNTIPTNSTSQP